MLIQESKAPKIWHRTYRTHDRINPYMSHPCHIEMAFTERKQIVPKPKEVAQKKKIAEGLQKVAEETEETKASDLGISSVKNKCK